MTSESETDSAWEAFKQRSSFEKASSLQDQLDAITAMLNDIKTDTERTAAMSAGAANAPMDQGMADPMMDMPPADMGAEDMAEEDDGDIDLPMDEDVPPEGSSPGLGAPMPESMPPMEPDDVEFPADDFAGADMDEEVPPIGDETDALADTGPEPPSPGEPPETGMIAQIKALIGQTPESDTTQLKGLSNLLSTALSQSQPAVPMQGSNTAEMNQSSTVLKSADKDDEDDDDDDDDDEEVEVDVEAESDAPFGDDEDDDDEDEDEDDEDDEDEGDDIGFMDDDDEDIVADDDEEVDDVPPMEDASEETGDVSSIGDTPEEAMASEIAEEIGDAVKEAVENALLGGDEVSEETESFEAPVIKSFKEMMSEKTQYGIDGQPSLAKQFGDSEGEKIMMDDSVAATGSARDAVKLPELDPAGDGETVDVETMTLEQTEGEDTVTDMNAMAIGKSMPSFADLMSGKASMDDFRKNAANVPDGDAGRDQGDTGKHADDGIEELEDEAPAEASRTSIKGMPSATIAKSAADTGRHIPTFAEMYSAQGGFVKASTTFYAPRPASTSAMGGRVERPAANVADIQKSARKPLRIGPGVDPHEAVADDWADYRARFGGQRNLSRGRKPPHFHVRPPSRSGPH